MYRRCADAVRAGLLLLGALALAACGSNPPLPDAATAAAEPPAEAAEPPAAQTFPLEGEGAQSSTTQLPTPAPTTAASTRPASASESAPQTKTAPATPATSATPEPPLPPEAVQQFENAVAMLNSGNSAAAEEAFRALSAAYPTYSGPLVNLGILLAKADRLEDAEKTFKEAIGRKADNAAAHNQLGIVYRRQGRFSEAEQAYLRAVEIDPNYANAYLNLGVLCDLYLQQPQRALEAFERYQSLSPNPDEKVGAWVKELKVRLESAQRASGAG